jgi:ribosomal-protein-alanine N-acetyltransferase
MELTVTSVRPMREQDIADVVALERRAFTEPWSEEAFVDELAHGNRRYVVAESGGVIVGYGGVMVVDEEGHIMTVAVEPAATRRKVGTRLMLELVDLAIASGASHLTLEVRMSNDAALGLYRKLGFASVGLRPGYYRDEDALVMWAVDAAEAPFQRRLDRIRVEVA